MHTFSINKAVFIYNYFIKTKTKKPFGFFWCVHRDSRRYANEFASLSCRVAKNLPQATFSGASVRAPTSKLECWRIYVRTKTKKPFGFFWCVHRDSNPKPSSP